eukprot:353375-Chlamydomonas_euryale.AAC.8
MRPLPNTGLPATNGTCNWLACQAGGKLSSSCKAAFAMFAPIATLAPSPSSPCPHLRPPLPRPHPCPVPTLALSAASPRPHPHPVPAPRSLAPRT